MIRCIVAVDSKNGMANDHGIPWDLPADRRYFREQTKNGIVIMGYGTYAEFAEPLPDRLNMVVARKGTELRLGFELITDIFKFLSNCEEDVWIIGGAKLFESTIYLVDELFITQIEGDYSCTKFFSNYSSIFRCVDKESSQTENGISFSFTRWKRTTHLLHKQR